MDLTQLEIDNNLIRKLKLVNDLKKQVIKEVKNYCRQINNGNLEFCYQNTMNKILFIEHNEDFGNINFIFN